MQNSKQSKFKTVKKIVINPNNTDNSQTYYGINLITSSKINTANAKRLLSPIEAEYRRSKLLVGTHSGASSIRKMRRPTRSLTLKAAPAIPTAPKNPVEIKKNLFINSAKNHFALLDKTVLFTAVLLSFIGVAAVYSASLSYNSARYVIIQLGVAIFGIFVMLTMSLIDYRQFLKKYRTVILINAALLLFTFIFGEGVTDQTNANWINLGFIKIQPSEFSKILFIYAFAAHLYFVRDRINKIFTALTLFLHAMLIILLTLLQKDLGTLTVFLFIFVVMSFAANLNIWYFISGAAAAVIASPFIWTKLNYFQQQRILAPYDPSVDPTATGIRHQAVRSMTAISLGGVSGSGYTNGQVTQGDFFAKHTDMIYSTICEEFGFIGGIFILILYAFLIYSIIKVALSCDNPFGCFICTGIAAMFIIQIIENIGMCLGIMPVIGITLPFLSYGGSSALSTSIAIGIVLSVGTHKERNFFKS